MNLDFILKTLAAQKGAVTWSSPILIVLVTLYMFSVNSKTNDKLLVAHDQITKLDTICKSLNIRVNVLQEDLSTTLGKFEECERDRQRYFQNVELRLAKVSKTIR